MEKKVTETKPDGKLPSFALGYLTGYLASRVVNVMSYYTHALYIGLVFASYFVGANLELIREALIKLIS